MRVTPPAEKNPTRLLAKNYDIKESSAQKIIAFAGKKNKMKMLPELGLTSKDVAPLLRLEMPEQASIQKISTKLEEDPAKIERLLADFVGDIKSVNDTLN